MFHRLGKSRHSRWGLGHLAESVLAHKSLAICFVTIGLLLSSGAPMDVINIHANARDVGSPGNGGDGVSDDNPEDRSPDRIRRTSNIKNPKPSRRSPRVKRKKKKKKFVRKLGTQTSSKKPKSIEEKIKEVEKRIEDIRKNSKISKRAEAWKKEELELENLHDQVRWGKYRDKVHQEAKKAMGGSENFCCTKGKEVLTAANNKWLHPDLPHIKELVRIHAENKAKIADEAIRVTNPKAHEKLTQAKKELADLKTQLKKSASATKPSESGPKTNPPTVQP